MRVLIMGKPTKRIQVVVTQEEFDIIKTLEGELGFRESEIVRNIVLGWLMEKSVISTILKSKIEDKGR